MDDLDLASQPSTTERYGVAPVVVALILRACWNLGKKTLGKDTTAWALFTIGLVVTAVTQKELTALFIGAGLFGVFWFGRRRAQEKNLEPAVATSEGAPPTETGEAKKGGRLNGSALPLLASWLPVSAMTAKLSWFFFKAGFLVFGSGLVIVPFLKSYVVDRYQWLGDRAFLDAVAIGMVSPGLVVITATFVRYTLDGVAGAIGLGSLEVLFAWKRFPHPILVLIAGVIALVSRRSTSCSRSGFSDEVCG